MTLEFSLNRNRMILLGICFLALSFLLILAGYMFGLMSGLKEAQKNAPVAQAKVAASQAPQEPALNDESASTKTASPASPADDQSQSSDPSRKKDQDQGNGKSQAPAADSKKATPPPPPDSAKAPPAAQAAAPSPGNGSDKKDDKASGGKKQDDSAGNKKDGGGDDPAAGGDDSKDPAPKPDAAATTWKEGYTVQVGSFTYEKNAQEMIDRILSLNYPAFMYLFTDSSGGIWYVVQAGEYDTKDEAAKTADQLMARDMIALVKPITESIRQKRKAYTN